MKYSLFCCQVLLLSCIGAFTQAATLTVDCNGGGDFPDVQSAITASANGDMVLVKPGEYVITEPINFGRRAITVKSEAGAEATVLRLSGEPDPFRWNGVVIFASEENESSILDGFTLTGDYGVACNDASPTLTNCTIMGNLTAGVSCGDASPILTNCMIWGNSGSGIT